MNGQRENCEAPWRQCIGQFTQAIFVAPKLQLQDRTCKPSAIFNAICRRDVAGVSNMFETCCNFKRDKNCIDLPRQKSPDCVNGPYESKFDGLPAPLYVFHLEIIVITLSLR